MSLLGGCLPVLLTSLSLHQCSDVFDREGHVNVTRCAMPWKCLESAWRFGGTQGVAGQLPCQEHALLQLEWDKIDLKQAT